MTRIDFYLLPQTDESSRLLFACRLAEKAWHLGNRMLVHVADGETGKKMDDLLWSFNSHSFLPHAMLPASQQVPVHIGWHENSGQHHDLLINLGIDVPAFFSRFERVTEIVNQNEQQRAESRERFRFYRERGYEIKINDMKKSA